MIHQLSLENFRKHKYLNITFTPGMNGIFGPNYTGKTTILYGILYCLGGITAVPCKTVIKNGCTTFKADMIFSLQGKKYFVTRSKSSDKLHVATAEDSQWELIANGTRVVNQHIEQLIGMSMQRFSQIRYSRQKFTSALLTLGATELHNILSEVSGADFVQKVLGRLVEMKKKLEWEIDGKELADLTSLNLQLIALEQEPVRNLEELQVAVDINLAAHQKAKDLLSAAVKAKLDYAEYKSEVESARYNLETADEALKEACARMEETTPVEESVLTNLRDNIADCKQTIREVDKLEDAVESLKKQLARASESLRKANNEFSSCLAAEREFVPDATLAEDLDEMRKEYEKLSVTRDAQFQEMKELDLKLKTGVCQSCKRPLHEDFNQAEAEEKLIQLRLEVRDLDQACSKLKMSINLGESKLLSERSQLEKLKAEVNSADKQRVIALRNHEIAVEEHEAAVKAADLAKGKKDFAIFMLDDYEKELAQLSAKAASRANAVEDYERCKVKYEKAAAAHAAAVLKECPAVEPEAITKLETEATFWESAVRNAVEAKAQAETENFIHNEKVEKVKAEIAQAEKDNSTLGKALTSLAAVKSLQKFLQQNKDDYMREVWACLMADASQLVSSSTGGDIESIQRTEDGKFSYIEDGQEFLVSEASGAQGAIMGLAVQTALARALPPVLDILLVDEPTADMDDEKSLAFSMLLPTRAGQVICISHSRMDSSMCNNIIDLGVQS